MRAKKQYFTVFLVTTLAGIGLHYLYDLLPVWPVAPFAVVRESLWEHMKLLFWPYLLSSVLLARNRNQSLHGRLLTLLLMCTTLLGISFWYHILLGGESVAADIGLYLFLMAAGFLLPYFLPDLHTSKIHSLLLPLTLVLAFLIVLFTFLPPDNILFLDLSGAKTWVPIPC